MVILVGMIAGLLIYLFVPKKTPGDEAKSNEVIDGIAESLVSFSPQLFFVVLLPPIIFNSGYHMRRELFFRHITPIASLAVIGTIVSAVLIAFGLDLATTLSLVGPFEPTLTELLTFGALISATDPVSTLAVFQAKRVDPHLFYLVFGESMLNDAVGLELFKAFAKFVVRNNGYGKIAGDLIKFFIEFFVDSIGSPLLGLFCGVGAALMFKHVDLRNTKLLELSLYILIMYVPFLLAEVLGLSGIVTILFTGVAAKDYIVPNLSVDTADNADVFFRLASHLAETAIFLELGMSVFSLAGSFHTRFILWAVFLCLLARACIVYPLVFVYNNTLRERNDNMEGLPSVKTESNKQIHVEMTEMSSDSDYVGVDETPDGARSIASSAATETPIAKLDLKIPLNTAHMLWFSGLRGAVAYACVRSFPNTFGHAKEFMATTMAIILLTVFVFGGSTELMLNSLKIEKNIDEQRYMENWHKQRASAGLILRLDSQIKRLAVRGYDESKKVDDQEEGHKEVTEEDKYHQIEITEQDYMERVRSYATKRDSLYDVGGETEEM